MLTKNELDKQAAARMGPATKKEISEMILESSAFLVAHPNKNYMLFSKELSHFVIFPKASVLDSEVGFLTKVINFIQKDEYLRMNVGSIVLIEPSDNFIEIWVGEYHFALFPCDDFIVEV